MDRRETENLRVFFEDLAHGVEIAGWALLGTGLLSLSFFFF